MGRPIHTYRIQDPRNLKGGENFSVTDEWTLMDSVERLV